LPSWCMDFQNMDINRNRHAVRLLLAENCHASGKVPSTHGGEDAQYWVLKGTFIDKIAQVGREIVSSVNATALAAVLESIRDSLARKKDFKPRFQPGFETHRYPYLADQPLSEIINRVLAIRHEGLIHGQTQEDLVVSEASILLTAIKDFSEATKHELIVILWNQIPNHEYKILEHAVLDIILDQLSFSPGNEGFESVFCAIWEYNEPYRAFSTEKIGRFGLFW
jgi:hypothetical protein